MPTYQYACTECDEHFEVVQAFTDPTLTVHEPGCGGVVRKLFGSVGVVFKGTGFYRNDSRGATNSSESGGSASDSSSGSSGNDSSGSSGSSDGGAAKTDSTRAAAPASTPAAKSESKPAASPSAA